MVFYTKELRKFTLSKTHIRLRKVIDFLKVHLLVLRCNIIVKTVAKNTEINDKRCMFCQINHDHCTLRSYKSLNRHSLPTRGPKIILKIFKCN